MELSEFKKLIETIHKKALAKEDSLAKIMSPAEFFAYDAISSIKGELESRKAEEERYLDSLFHPENNGYVEAEAVSEAFGEVIEFINAYLSGDEEVMDCILTPSDVYLQIDI